VASNDRSIDLVVVSYRTLGDLADWVDSLILHGPSEGVHVVIVDVDPLEDGSHLIRKLEIAGIAATYLAIGYNCGYGRACNVGARAGLHRNIGIFNADTLIRPGVIEACVEDLIAHPEWGVIGPRQVTKTGHLTHAGIFGTPRKPQIRGWKRKDTGQFSEVEQAVYVAGSAMFIRRDVWNEMFECQDYLAAAPDADGPMLETKHYYEDAWLCTHLRHHGYDVIYKGDVAMVHEFHKASPLKGRESANRHQSGSKRRFQEVCRAHGVKIHE